MLTAQVILYSVLVIVNVAAIIAWIAIAKRRHLRERVTWSDAVIGCVTSFLDTLGIGSYAQITALFKLRRRPADELIPGTQRGRQHRALFAFVARTAVSHRAPAHRRGRRRFAG